MAVLGLGIPRRRPFRQPQFRTTPPCLLLLSVSQSRREGRGNRASVGNIARLAMLTVAGHSRAFWVGWCDKAKLAVQDVHQVRKVPRAVRISRLPPEIPRLDRICPLMSVPVSGSRDFRTA